MIRAIIFDCFGVLTADSWHEFRAKLTGHIQEQASELNHRYCSASISKQEFLKAVSELTGESETVIQEVLDNEKDKNTELLRYIAELKLRYKIGLLSNVASNYIREKLLSPEEQKLFDVFVFSYEVKLIKPDPRIYQLAAERLGVKPEECVFIDDIERLERGAEQVGMKAIVYENLIQMKSDLESILSDADS